MLENRRGSKQIDASVTGRGQGDSLK